MKDIVQRTRGEETTEPVRHDPYAIVVFGVSGAGKSTVGKSLAAALHATFLEGDDYHPAANIAKMRSGQPLEDADRAPWLETLGRLAGECRRAGRPVVLACSALRRSYRTELLNAAGFDLIFVQLTVPPAVLQHRIDSRQQHFMPASLLKTQIETLEPLQLDECGGKVDGTGTLEQTVCAIFKHLPDYADKRATRS